jgi:hypothetical protein
LTIDIDHTGDREMSATLKIVPAALAVLAILLAVRACTVADTGTTAPTVS